ncbi:restriction endonuclease subunit S [Enterobacter cloacae]|uniref:restriction endonuclease subunit S n=1 Tax=Enterobacter cloacae TaxID=550 RepID=UPI0020063FFB|nr:restriction endonuclease subunit S [Enterobacter cloacae]MCK7267234.1 restriction endonuclease subunit S [Enterobacter cloacae]
MAKYKMYPEYKDSDIEWLGKIPSGWLLKKAKYIFQRVQRPLRDIDGVVTAFRDGQVTLRTNRRTDGFTNSVKEIGYQGVRRNDLVIHAMDGFAGAIGVSDSDGKCSPVCSVCIPWQDQPLNMRFYGYLVRQLAVTDFILSLAKGIRERSTEFRFNEFSGLMLPIPPVYEQDQIAKFLDHETAKIDNLIEKQQQLIELLKEKRQAVISHAVTKGLNPDVPMKDSGVEWLRDVPKHWIPARLKYHTRQIVDGAHFTPTYTEKGIPFLRVTDIQDKYIDFDNIKFIPEHEHKELIKRCRPENGDLLLSKNGTIGVPKLVDWDWEFSIFVSLCLIKFKGTLTPEYSEFYFKSHEIKEQVFGLIKQSTVINLHLDKIQNFWFCIPPLEEQYKIVNYLNEKIDTLECLIESAELTIRLAQERRTALISAAVTGKIDVRDWVAPDTQDIEEPQEATA